jgi:hypothetical protein
MNIVHNLHRYVEKFWVCGSVVVKVLRYYSDGPGMDSRLCHWIFQ